MVKKRRTSWRSLRDGGLTLIEVLAALAIVGVLMGTAVVAKARALRQLGLAEERLAAVAAADELLARWWRGEGAPVPGSGSLGGQGRMVWRTSKVASQEAAGLRAQIVRLRVSKRIDEGHEEPLFDVDVLCPSGR